MSLKNDTPSVSVLAPQDAIAREHEMLEFVSSGEEQFMCTFWESSRCLVVPSSAARSANFEGACNYSAGAGWPVIVRATGGDVVPQGAGVLNVSIAFNPSCDARLRIGDVYCLLCEPIVAELHAVGCDASIGGVDGSFCDGKYNVAVDGQKVAGTAQRWRAISRNKDDLESFSVLAHAMLLVECDIASGVDAVNAFNQACGIEARVRAGAHANIRDVAIRLNRGQETNAFVARLRSRYERLFTALI